MQDDTLRKSVNDAPSISPSAHNYVKISIGC